MKTKTLSILVILLFSGFSSLFAQGFQAPEEGKAVVYFTRISAYGGMTSFEFFHQDKFIGVFKRKNYLRYECNPGEQLFWASSENKEFITADLEAGKSYIVIVDIIIGTWKAHVGLTPISIDDIDKFKRAKKLILAKSPIVTPLAKMKKTSKKLVKFIPEKLKMYEKTWKHKRNFKHISSDMAIPLEEMR